MAGVVNDIEALAEFRAHLKQFNHDLAENFATIRGHWRELGEVWRDDMYGRFGEALEEVTPGITHYLSETQAHEAHLAALIEQLRGYLETGLGGLGSGLGTGAGQQVSRRDRDSR
jgi:thiamine pyrophosphate-dependent acetolactate synthase large subunit-like protein